MSEMMNSEIIVVGAGVIGCAAARSLARDHDVLVVEQDSIAAGSSGLAGASTFSSRFASDLPVVAGHVNQWFHDYDEAGRIDLTRSWDYEPVDPSEVDGERERVEAMAEQGYPVSFVEADELVTRCPWMDLSAFGGAIRHDDYAWVDPIEYTNALADDARNESAVFRTGVEVTGIVSEEGRVTGVETDDGVLTADTVVTATGWRTGDLLADIVSFPLRPYITQGCEIDVGMDVDPDEFPTVRVPVEGGEGSIYSDNQETLLLRPKHNGNLRVAGGHESYDRDEYDYVAASSGTEAEAEFVESVRRTVPELMVEVDEVTIIDDWAGTGGGLTPDRRPVIDTVDTLNGLVVATGFRAGFILSPIAARGIRSLVTGERCPFNLAPFAINRF